jgi:anti-sigma regulatory factor (Ser/Thr protein kinase)
MSGRADAKSGTEDRVTSNVPGGLSSVGPASGKSSNQHSSQSYLELGAMTSAVPSARLHAKLIMSEWGLPDLADVVELIVSELVTNAVQASEGLVGGRWRGQWIPAPPPVRLWLQADHTQVLIRVWDGSDRMPERQQQETHGESRREAEMETGRGLLIVETLCQRIGVYRLEGASGKVVWGEVAEWAAPSDSIQGQRIKPSAPFGN